MRRITAHIDLDAFFASVEEREKPFLKGAPIVVGADPVGGTGRGVVSTASYGARRYGIKSAMPISKAWRLCEDAKKAGNPACVFISPHHHKYGTASHEVFAIVRKHTPRIEQVSVDEAYIDLSHCGSFARARKVTQQIQREIFERLELSCSIGIGENKLIAKLASEARKPRGLTVITPARADDFLKQMPIRAIPGIGEKAAARFARRGINTVAAARKLSWEELGRMFGSWGFGMYERLRGIDDREVETEHEPPKSIGRNHTFDADTLATKEIFAVLERQAQKICRTLHTDGFKSFRTIVLTVRFADFETVTRSLTLKESIATFNELELKAIKLMLPFFSTQENPRKKKIRLVGLRVEKLL
ncbi:MAG: DNA polymerase IV [Parcubacteria group bacterium]|nr:DNA polymerase IV [Parcubacteria group bacterium]